VPLARRMSTTGVAAPSKWGRTLTFGAYGATTAACIQYFYGSAEDFFDYRFTTTKNPNDLAEFYASEDFMEIFCIFPFVVEFMMKNGEFAADAMPGYDQTVNTFGFGGPGGMEVSMAFDEGEIDTTGDGQADTVAYFNKRERFKDWAPFMPKYMNVVFWDLTQNFGYHRKADGTCEVYHHGETFYGPFPIRLIFTCHAYYVAWATERYIQRPDFGNRDKTDDLHELRKTIPIEVMGEFLGNLSSSVEKAKADALKAGQTATVAKHEETLSKLKDAKKKKLKSTMSIYETGGEASKVKVEVDNKEVQDTIRAALSTIGDMEKGKGADRQALEQLLAASELLKENINKMEGNDPANAAPKPLKKKIMLRRQSSLLAMEQLEAGAQNRAKAAGQK